MSDEVSFNIYVPSYKRANKILTKHMLEYCTYVIREEEEQDYRDAGITDYIAVEGSKINSAIKVFQWIIDNTPEDVVVIIDDDIEHLIYRMEYSRDVESPELATAEIERIAQVMVDLGIGYAGVDFTSRPYGYVREFAFTGIAGGLQWFNKSVYKAKMDLKASYNEDCDKCLQELLHNRIILNPKYICTSGRQDVNAGGENYGKLREAQRDSIEYMKLKWGEYFRYNYKTNVPSICVKR